MQILKHLKKIRLTPFFDLMWQCLTSNTFNITCWPTTVDLHALPVVVLGPGHLGLIVKLQQGAGQVQIQDILGWGDKNIKDSNQKLPNNLKVFLLLLIIAAAKICS